MDVTIEKKLQDLWKIQQIDTKLDNLNALMGELPMEVSDLEDEIVGLETRVQHIDEEVKEIQDEIASRKNSIKDFNKQIEKYDDQLNNIKNSREFEAITKEKEIAGLEIMAAEKKIKQLGEMLAAKGEVQAKTREDLDSRKKDLEFKKSELTEIVKENEEEMTKLAKESEKALANVEPRLARAYSRIRSNMRNGVSVAPIIRGSCGGCFSKIPPQRQSDIRAHFRIIDCEHCGRILVDQSITGIEAQVVDNEPKTTRRKMKLTAKAEG